MSMQSSWHTWDPGLVYFLWFSFVLSLLGNVSFPIMGANTLFLLRNVCILDWSKITMHWLCLRHNYYARISKAAFRTADRGRDSSSCERLCTTFKQKKGVPTHTHTHVLSFSQQPLPTPPTPPGCICLHEHNCLFSTFATGAQRASN